MIAMIGTYDPSCGCLQLQRASPPAQLQVSVDYLAMPT